ncbi:MAG: ribonucleoside-diphosphate reductase subunit alpha [Candidatus Moranbacteria bacterium]|nr:ribonucleoside-diphosphate reductase subunit alpha [Candidatus Moranbacteria bacterium]
MKEKKFKVIKSNSNRENFNLEKIKKVFERSAKGYEKECKFEIFIQVFEKNVVDEIKTSNINQLMVKTCIDLVSINNIFWQHVAARIFVSNLYKEAMRNRGFKMSELYSPESYAKLFDEYMKNNLYYQDFYKYYSKADILKAGRQINSKRDESYEYTTVLSLAKRYLLNPNKVVKELPQEMYMSVALFLAIPEKKENRLKFAFEIYEHCSQQRISLPTPTLLNARTTYHQLSSCFKLNIDDDLRAIYHGIENMAQISKFGGGMGVYLGNIRSRESEIRGEKGVSGGVIPWIKVINDTATAVNQQGTRLGVIATTLDVWHYDIYDFLDLQTETGDIRSKAFDIFPAISIPDLFMERVDADKDWTIFDPHEIELLYGKKLQDHFNKDFSKFYKIVEKDVRLKIKRTVKAKDLFKKFLKVTVETGMPHVFFRDTVNRGNANRHAGNIYSTQACTEICQNSTPAKFIEEKIENGKIIIKYEQGDFVVCNLASINIAKVHDDEMMAKVFPVVERIIDNVITLTSYPIEEARHTAERYRSMGIGYLGLAEHLAVNKISYESKKARNYVNKLFERYSYYTYRSSVDLAKERGTYKVYKGSDYDRGLILGKKESWYVKNTKHEKAWKKLFADMKKHGVRFSYHTAPAPNTSTAGIVGTTAAMLPIYKRYFVETNLSAPTVRVAPKLDKKNYGYYKEYMSMDMNDVIEMMSVIYQWMDQSISFEWMIDPARTSPLQLYNYYFNAWRKGIKTVYYVRSLSGEVEQEPKNVCVSCSG